MGSSVPGEPVVLLRQQATLGRVADDKVQLRLLEFHVVHHCNLTCAMCSHFSPRAAREFVSRQALARDVRQAASRLQPECVHVLGGEPLLHPELADLLPIFRPAFLQAQIKLVSNGVLVARRAPRLLPVLASEGIMLAVSVYPDAELDTSEIAELTGEYGVELEIWEQSTFLDFMNLKGDTDPGEARAACHMGDACNVRDGRLFPCPVTAWADFGHLPFDSSDGVPLTASAESVAGVLDRGRATSLCRFCKVEATRVPHRMTPPVPQRRAQR